MEFAIKTILLQGLTLLLPEMITIRDRIVQVLITAQDQVILVAVVEDRLAAAEEAEEDNPIRFTYIVLN